MLASQLHELCTSVATTMLTSCRCYSCMLYHSLTIYALTTAGSTRLMLATILQLARVVIHHFIGSSMQNVVQNLISVWSKWG